MGKNIIAVVIDFDITLSPYYQQKELLAHWGEDEDEFWQKCTSKVIDEDYDLEHGYIKVILEYIDKNPNYAISNQDLYNIGKNIQLYDGLSKRNNQNSIFDDIDKIIKTDIYKELNIEVEYYIISGGLTQMIKGALYLNQIEHYFKKIFACSLDEDPKGIINFPKETVGHTIKTQKLFQISKGLNKQVNDKIDTPRIPFENFIYLGDGETDIPAFSLINQMGGTSIAVYRESKNSNGTINEEKTKQTYKKSYTFAIKSQRAKQLLPANYSDAKPLKIALLNYIEMLCDKFSFKK
jgi:hypothetical protein